MRISKIRRVIFCMLTIPSCVSIAFAKSGQTGSLSGKISGTNATPLPAATVLVVGTNNGASADLDGNYFVRNISAGIHDIAFSYVGYKTKILRVIIKPGVVAHLNVTLQETGVTGKTVVVTAQRSGQEGAINLQLKSNNIANVVAADRLQANPDANLAEAIGRLPGISLIRSGGEGVGLVIRGLDPSYSQIMLNGVPVPISLSDISQYDVKSVEVFKTVTPDMQGDAVAGNVNLTLEEAPKGFKFSVTALPGYNNLNNYWGNYKYVANVSDRFFNNKLGVILGLDAENTNTSDQTLGASYEVKSVPPPGELAPLYVDGINLNDVSRVDRKDVASLVLDYEPTSITKVTLMNFFTHSDLPFTEVSKSYAANSGSVFYNMTQTPDQLSDSYVGELRVVHQFEAFELDEGVSYQQYNNYTPFSRNWSFSYNGTGLQNYGTNQVQSEPLSQILAGATDTLSNSTLNNFYLGSMGWNSNESPGRNIDAYVNAKIPFGIGHSVSGYFKLGGEYTVDQSTNDTYAASNPVGGLTVWGNYAIKNFPWAKEFGQASLTMQGMNSGTVNHFLNGKYNFGWYPDFTRLNQVFDWWNNYSNYYIYDYPDSTPAPFTNGYIGFIPNWQSILQNYSRVNDFYYAGYVMGELDLGSVISFVPGVRYEQVRDDLGGWFFLPTNASSQASQRIKPGYSTYAVHQDKYWLPMIHLKIKPTDWFQSMLSFTQTLHRGGQMVPDVYVNTSTLSGTESYTAGNPTLSPEFWTNYDAQFAFFGDRIGLLSVTGFYKKVVNALWTPSIYRVAGQPWPYASEGFNIGQYFGGNSSNSTVLINIPQNHTFPDYLWGAEFETQTNFWYLPFPFNNVSLDLNFTLVNSRTKYEYSKTNEEITGYTSHGAPIYQLVAVDSIYQGPMLNQPKSIVNLSLGYNYEGFNLWLSYQYTGSMVTSFPNLTEFENIVYPLRIFDIQLTQKLPVNGLEFLFDLANINNPVGYQSYLADPRPSYSESYGWTADFGLRYTLQ